MFNDLTLMDMAKGLADKQFSSVELTTAQLDSIRAWQPELNAFISVTEDSALAAASAADAARSNGTAGAFTGIPIAQKDIFCTQGIKTTCGSRMLADFNAPYSATVVEKMDAAGLVMMGKTNLDEFAMGSSNENSYFGAVKNPWDLTRVPGGSSGGSAAAVAARLCVAATGTDTGGSIRQPASHCGITGIKPTYGRVSRYGMIAFASSLDQGGIFTQTAEDAAAMLGVMADFDPKDSTSIDQPVPDYLSTLNRDIKGLRIGLPKEYFSDQLDSRIAEIIQTALSELEKQGAELIDISLPHTEFAVPTYYIIAPAEASSNLSRYDGVRFGHRCDNPQGLEDLYKRSRGEGFGSEVKRRIMIGTYALSAGYYDAYYIKAQQVRRKIRDDFIKAYESVDIIACPTSPSTAFPIGDKNQDPISMYLSDIYTIAVNLAGLPAMSVPAGFAYNMPVGLQLIGQFFDESRLLNVAHKYQMVTDWHKQQPSILTEVN